MVVLVISIFLTSIFPKIGRKIYFDNVAICPGWKHLDMPNPIFMPNIYFLLIFPSEYCYLPFSDLERKLVGYPIVGLNENLIVR